MRRINYPTEPSELKVLRDDYLSRFGTVIENFTKRNKLSKRCKESRWREYKKKYRREKDFKWSVKDIMIADYKELVAIYERGRMLPPKEKEVLKSIFNYDSYEAIIADFFVSHAKQLKLHSCFYCETAYINVYTKDAKNKKHFDVDHVLPKSVCPILALSLFNFVPSCQVCNSRIKKSETIGDTAAEWEILSPSSPLFDFEKNVRFRLYPLKGAANGFLANPSNFMIKVKANSPYDKMAEFFHLEERYEYHKIEALRLKDLKAKYPISNIKRIARLLHKSVSTVEEDLFHRKFLKKHDRCFRKFSLDILRND